MDLRADGDAIGRGIIQTREQQNRPCLARTSHREVAKAPFFNSRVEQRARDDAARARICLSDTNVLNEGVIGELRHHAISLKGGLCADGGEG